MYYDGLGHGGIEHIGKFNFATQVMGPATQCHLSVGMKKLQKKFEVSGRGIAKSLHVHFIKPIKYEQKPTFATEGFKIVPENRKPLLILDRVAKDRAESIPNTQL